MFIIFENEELEQFLLNVVEIGLYEELLTKVIGWFLVCFDLKQEFIHFIYILYYIIIKLTILIKLMN